MFGYRTDIKIRNIKEKEIWHSILIQLQKIYRGYLEDYDFQDSLFWYNERSNVGALSGAIWKLGGYALEEYVAKKGEKQQKGRIDLYFCIGDYECIVEAKQEWLYFNKGCNDFHEKITKSLQCAVYDCEQSLKNEVVKSGFGITFVVPYYQQNFNYVEEIKQLENELLNNENYNFIAIFSIDHDQQIVSTSDNVCNSVYVIGQEVIL